MTLQKLASLEEVSRKAKDEFKQRLSDKNDAHYAYDQINREEPLLAKNTAYRLYKGAERNETRHTGALTRVLRRHDLSLEQLEEQSLNVRLDELGKRIRDLESQLLGNEKALGR